MTRIVVIGAGPAGLAAAASAAQAGADVVIVDEGERVGGQFWRHHPTFTDPRLQHQLGRFAELEAALAQVRVLSSASVWRVEAGTPLRVHALIGPVDAAQRQGETLEADAVVLATGAHDRVLPVPGWTLPGATSAGAVQALAKRDGIALGTRTVVAGAGPFLLPVAQSVAILGGEVAEVVEAASVSTLLGGWGRRPWELTAAAGKAGELGSYLSTLVKHRTPYRLGSAVTRIHGTSGVEAVTVQRIDRDWRPIAGTERTVECDAVALGHGFTPRLEAAIQFGCEITSDRFVRVDGQQLTSVPGVHAAGEITGIGGADAALAEGAIAGLAAAGVPEADLRYRAPLSARRRMRAFAERLKTHSIRPGWTAWLDDDTIVCRCESTTRATILEYAEASTRGMRLATRAGLGPCQGRTCGRSVEDILGAPTGIDRRPVLSSVRIGELAAHRSPATADPVDGS
ncbi:FAD-dependent oxidoreductase [Microbacterium arabinogalactanolyticum]|uniref:FAD-dependent oxidoreductase n=1 Tax=Microbacterium arabinogalactanolyticum TaxID=69365 RepID=UPI002553683C|nr:FAD-dependent oxidoreductase [Microbacterium arabinogalactanolyticum]GLC86313.1 pyridine nucleotide-disulfide oxidoreductase [Microbacterium arabinogalactanolyticum]